MKLTPRQLWINSHKLKVLQRNKIQSLLICINHLPWTVKKMIVDELKADHHFKTSLRFKSKKPSRQILQEHLQSSD